MVSPQDQMRIDSGQLNPRTNSTDQINPEEHWYNTFGAMLQAIPKSVYETVGNVLKTEENKLKRKATTKSSTPQESEGLAKDYFKSVLGFFGDNFDTADAIKMGSPVTAIKTLSDKIVNSGMSTEDKNRAIKELAKAQTVIQGRIGMMNEYAARNPYPQNIVTNTAVGISGMLPDIALANLGGAGTTGEAAAARVARMTEGAPTVVAKYAPKAAALLERAVKAPFTKVMATKGAAEGGANNEDNPLLGLTTGAIKGAGEGIYMHVLGEGASKVSPYIAKVIGKTGATSEISTALANPLANAGVFTAAKALRTPLEEGRLATADELAHEAAMGIGFSLLHAGQTFRTHQEANHFYENTLKTDPQESLGRVLNEKPENILRDYDPNLNVKDLTEARNELKSVIVKEPDLAVKKQLGDEALKIQNQLDAKEAVEGIVKDKDALIEMVDKLPELTADQKVEYVNRIEQIAKDHDPIEVKKGELNNDIKEGERLISDLKERLKTTQEPSEKIEIEDKINRFQGYVERNVKELTDLISKPKEEIKPVEEPKSTETTETPSTSKESTVQPLNTQESVSRVYESDNKIKEVGTEEEFKAYSDSIFPESKIKDVVYHGTNNEFKTFEKGHTDAKNSKTDTQGIHFIDEGSTKEYGDNYGRMVPAKLDFKNPLEIEATRENADMVERLEYLSQKDIDDFKNQGYDSAIIKRGTEREYIAFEPEQIVNLSDLKIFKAWKQYNKKEDVNILGENHKYIGENNEGDRLYEDNKGNRAKQMAPLSSNYKREISYNKINRGEEFKTKEEYKSESNKEEKKSTPTPEELTFTNKNGNKIKFKPQDISIIAKGNIDLNKENKYNHFDVVVGDDIIGEFGIRKKSGYVFSDHSELHGDNLGKGLGKVAYIKMAEYLKSLGKTLRSSSAENRNEMSDGVWRSLERDGMATKVVTGYDRYYVFNNESLNKLNEQNNNKSYNTQEAQKPKETTTEAGKESVTKRFTLKDLKDISDGSGLVRKGEEFTNTEKLTSKLKKGDKIKFFAERERTGIYNGKAIIDDKGNQWGILAILTDKNGWIEVQSETIKNEKQNNNIDKQTKESITGITQEATAKARKAMGIEAYEKTSQSNEQRRAKAEKAIKDGYNVKQLIQNIKNSEDFVPSRQEMEILKIYDNSLEAAFNKNPTTELLAERADLLRTVDIGTSRAGAALQAVAGVEASVDNLANFLQAEAVHYGVDELPQNIIDDLKGKYEKGQEAKRAYEEGYQKAKDELIKQQAEAELAKQRKKSKSSVKKSSADYASERAELKQSIKDKLKKARGQLNAVPVPYLNELIAIAPDVAKLVRSYVEEGVSKLDDIVKKVHSDLKDDIDGITEQDVIDLISGQYNPKRPTKTEILSQVRDLREQAKLLKKIEDLENGKIPNDPVKQVRRNAELEALRKQIKELEDEVGITEQRTLKSRRTALDNKIKQLQDDLETGNFDLEPAEPRRVRLDAETQKKQDEYIAFLKETNRRRDQAVYNQQSKITKAWLKFQQVLGLRRLIQTSIDFSMPFRQAVTVTLNPRYFRTTLQSFGNMFKSTVSEKKYDRIMFAIQQDPLYNDMRADGLMFSEVDSKDNLKREEDYRTSFLYKIPYLREPFLASNRAAAGYINTARYNLYLKGVERLRAQGITHENSPENYAALAKWTMNMTGRGNLLDFMEKGENASKWQRIMGDTFYGTRLMASRFNMLNPNYYIKMPKEQRIEALKDIGSYVALSGIVALGAIGAGAKVSLDPEDADFLKAKWGDKRYDIFSGGMNTYLRTAYRLMKAILQRTNPKLYGENKDKAALKKANKYGSFAVKSGTDFFRYKLAPNTSYVLSGTLGKDPLGRDFNPNDILRFYPMYGDDLYSSWQKGEGGLEMLSILAPSLFGIGVQEYSNKKKPTKEKE